MFYNNDKGSNKHDTSSVDLESGFDPNICFKCPITANCIKTEPSGAVNKHKFKNYLQRIRDD